MSLFDSFDIFPVLRTKRIVIGQDKISIQALLSTKDNNSESSWLGSSNFKEYIKIYFLLVPQSRLASVKNMSNPQTRFTSRADQASLPENYDMVEISLSEILQRDYIGSVSETDMMAGTMVNDLYFEVDLPGTPSKTMPHYLLGFIHLDVATLSRDLEVPDGIIELGGNHTLDILLEVRNGNLRVPETTEIFFLPDGTQYFGPAHYHSPSNPGPEIGGIEYVGWMAGYKDGPMGTTLNTRKVRYTKVVARQYIDTAGFNSGFNGAMPYDFETLDGASESTGGDLERLATRIQTIDNNILVYAEDSERLMTARKRASLYYSKLNKDNLLISNSDHFISVETDSDSAGGGLTLETVTEDSYHGILFSLEYGDILSLNSAIGWLFEYHTSVDNPNYDLVEEFITNTNNLRVKVDRVRVTNSPVTNTTLSTPAYQTHEIDNEPICLVYTADDKEGGILKSQRTENFYDNRPLAYIQELALRPDPADRGKKFYRSFLVKDFDLYQNVNFGNYKYMLDVDVSDGIKKVIEQRYKIFRQAQRSFIHYLQYSGIPTIYTTSEDKGLVLSLREQSMGEYDDKSTDGIARRSGTFASERKISSVGSYDHVKDDFTDRFRQTAVLPGGQDIASLVNNIVDAFVMCYEIITRGQLETGDLKSKLRKSISPSTVVPGGLEDFSDMCERLDLAIKKIAENAKIDVDSDSDVMKSTSIDPNMDLNTKGASKNMSLDFPFNIFNLTATVPGIATALTGVEVLYEPPVARQSERQNISPTQRYNPQRKREMFSTSQSTTQGYGGPTGRAGAMRTLSNSSAQGVSVSTPKEFYTVSNNKKVTIEKSSAVNREGSAGNSRSTYGNAKSDNQNKYNAAMSSVKNATREQGFANGTLAPAPAVIAKDALTGFQALEKELGITIRYSSGNAAKRLKKAAQKSAANQPTSDRKPQLVSKEFEQAICAAAIAKSERSDFIKEMQSVYKDTVLAIEDLGEVFDDMKMISAEVENLSTDFKRDFQSIANTGKDNLSTTSSPAAKAKNIFEKNTLELKEIRPGKSNAEPLSSQATTPGLMSIVKYEPRTTGGDVGVLVNNVFILE